MSSFFKVASFLFELMNFPYFEISPPPKGSEISTGRSLITVNTVLEKIKKVKVKKVSH